jgi:hypothetical protein
MHEHTLNQVNQVEALDALREDEPKNGILE